ncbi:hypothetical protein P8452_28822 [Trifolium repens]|nr:hypothetical protein P8452_28822 [Trifolium repens]
MLFTSQVIELEKSRDARRSD